MMTEGKYLYYSSSIIKEIVSLGGSVRDMVPDIVEKGCDGNSANALILSGKSASSILDEQNS